MASSAMTRQRDHWSGLWTDDPGLQGVVDTGRNQVLEAQGTEPSGAPPDARRKPRQADRPGDRPRRLTPRVGPLVLPVPHVRDGSCSTPLVARSQRSAPAWG